MSKADVHILGGGRGAVPLASLRAAMCMKCQQLHFLSIWGRGGQNSPSPSHLPTDSVRSAYSS